GPPFSPQVGFDQMRASPDGEDMGQRPMYLGAPGPLVTGGVEQYFNALAFGLPAPGFQGNLGRNVLEGPGLTVLNLALHKRLLRTERHDLRLRIEAFNIANRPNFAQPDLVALFNSRGQRQASAGRIAFTTTPARQMQVVLRWQF
ncbi:MAG: hypothetical protein ACRD44_05130, partial [Bryobacteraceae bacterium]